MSEMEVDMGGGRGDGGTKTEKDPNWIPNKIKKRVCTTFVEDSFSNGQLCQCGGGRDSHATVTLNDYFSSAIVSHWDSAQHSCEVPTDAFGEVEFTGASKRHSYFMRLSWETPPATAYFILTNQWGLPRPNLVLSVVGGVGRSKVKTWVREVLRQGLVRAAQSTGAWILSGGLREGVGRCLGEAVRDHATAASSDSLTKVVAIGIAPWGLVQLREQLVNPEGSFPAEYYVSNTSRDSCCLDNNYQAFLLVDDGSVGRIGGEAGFRARLENYISHQRTGKGGSGSMDIPVLCILVSGEPYMLERLDISLKNCIPWLVLAGSGGLADLVSDILENVSAAPILPAVGAEGEGEVTTKTNLRERVAERVVKHFPSEPDVDKLVDKLLNIHQSKDLISIYHGEQEGPDDFDTVLLKALVRASKQRLSVDASPNTEELKLAVTWNRVDIARSELFTGDIQWKNEDLESFMTDALVNDKPQFVRLFTENGLNVMDYLTYRRLEELYRSISDSSVAYTLLQRCLAERQGLASIGTTRPAADSLNHSGGPAKGLTMYEVSQLLEDLLGDVCEPFYRDSLGLQGITSRRKTMKKLTRVLQEEDGYRAHRCPFPWASLFIWAVLQNRSEMAVYFWEMTTESVLSALSACKLLRELCKLESETETKLSLKELAQRFEILAHDVFSKCYQNSESRSFVLLKKKSAMWRGATCLKMAMEADARHFFSHDGVQTLLSQIWWGDMDRSTETWKLVLTLFIPPLCYTSLISFREVEEVEEGKPEETPKGKEMDWLYAETVFSFSDMKRIQAKSEELSPMRSTPRGPPARPPPPKRPFVLSRWRQFWYAPVTAFLGNVLMYFLFLLLFAYVLLVDFKPPPPSVPSPMELLLYFWVLTIVCEEIRATFFIGNITFRQRIRQYTQDLWHKCDLIAITLFLIGLCCRMFESSFWFGRAALCLDYMVFTLRLIHIFAIHKQLGPKIIIVGKMMKDVFFFLFFLAVWMMAYGVANQGLIYSFDPSADRILRRVFYRPYLHIFGQIPVEEMDSGFQWDVTCTTNATEISESMEPCRDTRHNWLVVILLVVYLLVTNILLINLLIAMFRSRRGATRTGSSSAST
ncbi:transient receptor potential cation channel subfamily M member 4-like isoform X2 [Salminus brasiliensis]|uniref:transient receptor potential cation channel subfamily M member 4-like isoform X2 n=1 Tax=Salminus brasiliensis TaxID=930266 RepID=UPI003B8376C7